MGINQVKGRVKKWRVRYYEVFHEGGRLIRHRTSKYFVNRDLAKAFWHEKSRDSEAYEAGLTKIIPITLNRFIAEMTDGHFAHKAPKYLAGEWGRLENIAANWEGKEMHKIEAPEIQAFLYRLSDEGLATKTVKNYHGLLSLIFNQAKLRHHVESNPMDYVPAPKVVPRREVTALSEIEIARLVKAGESPEWEKTTKTALILIHTGMRLGEMLRVRVERDVDFERNCLRVRSVEGAETKNKKPRVIPFSGVCRGFLEAIKVGPIWSGSGRTFDVQLRKLGEVLKIHLHAHRFRHTFASLNLAAGVPEPIVSAWLGHGSSAITKRYTHMSGYDLQFARLEVGKNLRPICAQFDEKPRKVMAGDER